MTHPRGRSNGYSTNSDRERHRGRTAFPGADARAAPAAGGVDGGVLRRRRAVGEGSGVPVVDDDLPRHPLRAPPLRARLPTLPGSERRFDAWERCALPGAGAPRAVRRAGPWALCVVGYLLRAPLPAAGRTLHQEHILLVARLVLPG